MLNPFGALGDLQKLQQQAQKNASFASKRKSWW